MKDLSLLLFKSSISLKLKKGIKNFCTAPAPADPPAAPPDPPAAPPMTLEQMIRRLEMEEEAARRSKAEEDRRRRTSEVNSSDILRSARKALDQYPRFSVDVRETKYRSSFLGERVVWRKPGIVARLMGLEAIPVAAPPPRGGAPARRRRSAAVARREKERLLMGLQRRLRESVGSCSAAPPPEDWRRFSGFR